MNRIDDTILYYINDKLTNPILEKFMIFCTHMGDFCFIWLAYCITAFLRGERKLVVALVVVMLLVNAINNGFIKAIFRRKRPFEDHPDIKIHINNPYGSSFPSGHSANGFACAIVIGYFYPNFGFIAFIIASLIAISRMYLKVHYFTDVFFGSLVGILIGIAYVAIIW
ncbi:undecaprenyl-diphosphatase [Breznakia sp. PF5-3]|uniref:phosphatase PAP2 family protein n=1 Tax=unclassified Breznakia TaxID=2623764 RepID=UPI002404DF31|nr:MULTISPECIES: phosphatase PAP2 family protein [unclassified Breznakia]MDF9824140.1 undecaprenyl-diphosphatase [Breznakia sp. PM6-1]MDF9834938.1 undecaprenyl-diphosphatase [Breznakia sp. PF5-3]MDF9837193.1 undecaprenyl-diphosphatase [Breznakia sp. PFB2-8]MDF9859183.1 undecaprenyl-diphosphatase [Breznakia sp. PH5-24]